MENPQEYLALTVLSSQQSHRLELFPIFLFVLGLTLLIFHDLIYTSKHPNSMFKIIQTLF